jgi:hypothetical protein
VAPGERPGCRPSGSGAGAANGVSSGSATDTSAASAGALAVTGPSSAVISTIGFAFIIGGASVLYFTRLGDRGDETTPTHVPTPRDRRPAGTDAPVPGRRRPSPQAARRER